MLPASLDCPFVLPKKAYKPITNTAWVRTRICKLQKGCTRFAAASDKVYQLFVHGRCFSTGTPASSTNKTGRHDIAEILLKVTLNTKIKIKSGFLGPKIVRIIWLSNLLTTNVSKNNHCYATGEKRSIPTSYCSLGAGSERSYYVKQ
jgi:hypothetical protein